jgi:metallo-beta-lactamase class B
MAIGRAPLIQAGRVAFVLAMALAACAPPGAVSSANLSRMMRGWNRPVDPLHIVGNIYFVGTNELAMFLLTTPAGHILIDSGFDESVPLVRASVMRLGFRFEDIKIVLVSHAHSDHVGGLARVKEMTGARLLATAPDAALIQSGGGGPLALGMTWRPAVVDGVLEDGQEIALGGTVLVAHLTAGHTPGATTWTTVVQDDPAAGGRKLNVVFFSSATLFEETPLRANPDYPRIASDFEHSYAFWKSVPCDVFLAPHGSFFQLEEKRERAAHGASSNPFVDPAGWKRLIAAQEATFRRRLAAGN